MAGSSLNLLLLVAAMAFLPILAVSVTAFTKFSVTIMILRNALGIQQLPPNIVVYSLAIILSGYIAMPMLSEGYRRVEGAHLTFTNLTDYREAADLAATPLRDFLKKHTNEKQTAFFVQSTEKIWPADSGLKVTAEDIAVLAPSFLLTQLTQAFEIGFLLYLPFLAIDIVVTAILTALGMMMVSPNSISIPFKLMLFVFVEGWSKLAQGLILTYS